MKWYDILLIMALGFVSGQMLYSCVAKAEELSEIDKKSAGYCALYSRELVRIRIMHPEGRLVADTDIVANWAIEEYKACLSILPAMLPVPASGAYKEWLADMRDLIILNAGTEPASDTPQGDLNDEEWRAQCRAEYNTWEEETGTVIRRGNPERVRCPCGGEVTCGQ